VAFLRNFVELLVIAITVLILGRILVSWVDPTRRSQLSSFLYQVTEPILAPVRRVLPQTGMIDFSPMIVILILSVILQMFRT
jgi:YggT family protein